MDNDANRLTTYDSHAGSVAGVIPSSHDDLIVQLSVNVSQGGGSRRRGVAVIPANNHNVN